ncbi:Allantoinase [[Actinomadura] parvosata subsp. kistnae]|nr:Allantoinase [Actinomadura parvosata subsp. kistnae]
MTPFDLVVRSRRTVTPEGERAAAVAVRGERIAALYDYAAPLPAAEDVDLRDLALLPGLVDTHVHVNEPGRTHWEGFDSATRAAAAGGVTTIVDMPLNSLPPAVSCDALDAKLRAAEGQCHVDVAFWGGAVPGNVKDLAPLHGRGVRGFKCFMSPSGVEEFPPLADGELRLALEEVAGFGGLVIVHAEDPELLAEPEGPATPRSWPRGPAPPSAAPSPGSCGWRRRPAAGCTSCTSPAPNASTCWRRRRRAACRSPPRRAPTT